MAVPGQTRTLPGVQGPQCPPSGSLVHRCPRGEWPSGAWVASPLRQETRLLQNVLMHLQPQPRALVGAVACGSDLSACDGGHTSERNTVGQQGRKVGRSACCGRRAGYEVPARLARAAPGTLIAARGGSAGATARRRARLADAVPLDRSVGSRHRGERSGAGSKGTAACSRMAGRRVGARHDGARRSVCALDRDGSRA